MKLYSKYIYLFLAAMAFILTACSDEFDAPSVGGEIIEGRPANIAIATNVGSMSAVSRAEMSSGKDKEISSIWLGFFNEQGKLVHKFIFGEQATIGTSDQDFNTLSPIEMTSGQYHIAAVANPRGNYGVLYREDGSGVSTATELMTLLERDDLTFEDYLNIAFIRGNGSYGAIDTPTGNLPMQGVFIPGSGESHPISSDRVEELTKELVYIAPTSGSNVAKIDGTLHFRRLVTQNKFNITYDSKKIKEFEVVQARIYNVPAVSWIAERGDNSMNVNAGDHIGIIGKTASTNVNEAKVQPNYMLSPNILGSDIRKVNGGFQLDWWQLENRRNAVTETLSYEDRENERKASDGRNTGIYTALTGESGEVTANNCATYIQLRVRMEMQPGSTSSAMGENSQMTTVDALYTIHLGYCEDEKAKDFNCRRNSKYTYNVKVLNVDKIVLEAQKEDGVYENGAEGTVTFVTTKFYEADAHYSAYNVSLSNRERSEADWQIRVYTRDKSGNESFIDINSANCDQYDEKYYNWIELRPTSGENVIAPYKPVQGTGVATSNKTFGLKDLQNLADYPAYNNVSTLNDTQRWYTVFVNEYIYEDGYNSNTSANWQNYIGLSPRIFWLKVQEYRSDDQESIVINSKYAIRQKSIQSFYSKTSKIEGVVFGIENVNELYGIPLNQNMPKKSPTGSEAREMNYNYFKNNGNSTSWNTYISNYNNTAAPLLKDGEETGVIDLRNAGAFTANYKGSSHYYSYSRYANEACLNRNRDLNGNGVIDENEVRWILPDINQYVRMVLGATALQNPIIDFKNYADKNLAQTAYYEKSQFHFASIDGNQLWAEELVSTGWNGDGECPYPQQARCIRYLGNDMAKFDSSNFKLAVEKISGENKIKFNYASEVLRSLSSEALPVHRVKEDDGTMADYNRPSEYLEYKEEVINVSSINWETKSITSNELWHQYLESNNPCDIYNTNGEFGWRVPNQVEIMSLLNAKVLTGGNHVTCTKEYISPYRNMGADATHGLAFEDSDIKGSVIRCVRDVLDN